MPQKNLNVSPALQVLCGERPSSMPEVAFQEPDLAGRETAALRDTRFSELVERRARFVYRVAYAILRNPDDSEDVVQETFLRLYRTEAWQQIADEKAFLARIAWRVAVNRLPKRRIEPDPELPSKAPSPEAAAIEAEWNTIVHRFIDALPEKLRQPLALSTLDELSSRQIAGVMGIAEGTVRTRLMRARQILKQKLAGFVGRSYENR